MMKKQGFKSLLFVLLLLMQGTAFAKDIVAKVVSAIGTVDVIRYDSGIQQPLVFKSAIYLGDSIVTGVGSQAKLLLSDSSILKIGPSSELQINEMVIGVNDASKTTIDLIKGRLRSVIGKKLSANSHYEIHTSVAIAGVRGTDFEVVVSVSGETLVRSFEGSVAVVNVDIEVPGEVLLEPNTFTAVTEGTTPEAPEEIAPGEDVATKQTTSSSGKEDKKEEKGSSSEESSSQSEESGEDSSTSETEEQSTSDESSDDGSSTNTDESTSDTTTEIQSPVETETTFQEAEANDVLSMDFGEAPVATDDDVTVQIDVPMVDIEIAVSTDNGAPTETEEVVIESVIEDVTEAIIEEAVVQAVEEIVETIQESLIEGIETTFELEFPSLIDSSDN